MASEKIREEKEKTGREIKKTAETTAVRE